MTLKPPLQSRIWGLVGWIDQRFHSKEAERAYTTLCDVARWIQQLITVYPAYLATRNEDTKEALLRWRSLAAKQFCSAVVDELECHT